MKLYYFIHSTGRNLGNSGIPRVVRNLGAQLQKFSTVDLVPVRWDPDLEALVHAENELLNVIKMHRGPSFPRATRGGKPIHADLDGGSLDGRWLLIPEVPHLDDHQPPLSTPIILGYAKNHGLKTAFIFHDILPLSHFGRGNSESADDLKWVIYANALAGADLVAPNSIASGMHLSTWLAKNGLSWNGAASFRPILLPEEMRGVRRGRHAAWPFLTPHANRGAVEFCMWGTVFPHKNQLAALKAFNRLCELQPSSDLRLHVFGSVAPVMADLVESQVSKSQGRITLHGFVTDKAMAAVIKRCRASIFISLAEGYGLPLAESLWLGKPCLTSNLAPMTEIALGGGCLLVDPADQDAIVDALSRLATDDALVERLSEETRSRPLKSWRKYAEEVIEAIQRCSEAATQAGPQEAPFNIVEPSTQTLIETINLGLGDLSISGPFKTAAQPLLEDGALRFSQSRHSHIEEKLLFHGPYWSLSRGVYDLAFTGSLDGELIVRATAKSGDVRLGQWLVKSFDEPLRLVLERRADDFEVVAFRTDETREFVIQALNLERYPRPDVHPPGRALKLHSL